MREKSNPLVLPWAAREGDSGVYVDRCISLHVVSTHTYVGDLYLPMRDQFVRMGRENIDSWYG